jgi:outer membrane receptor protein involved in Fe transport
VLTGANAGTTSQCTNEAAARGFCTQGEIVSLRPLETNSPFRTGDRQAYGGSASGGGDRLTFYVGGDVQQENGVQATNNQRKTNFRANFRGELRPAWDVTVNTGYVRDQLQLPVNDNSTLGLLSVGLLGRPLSNDSLAGGYFNRYTPQELSNISVRQNTDRFTTSVTSNAQALSWLSFSGVAGLDYVDQATQQAVQPNRVRGFSLEQGSADSRPQTTYTWTAQGSATATLDLRPELRSTTQAGAQYSRELFRGTNAFGAVLVPGTNSLSGTSARFTVSEYNTDNILLGVFGQEQVAWRDRVFLTGGLRGDRNSAFGENYGFTYYPFVNTSWVVSDEGFYPANNVVSSTRLRAAWGRSGQRPRFRDAISYFNPTAVRVDGEDQGAITFGLLPTGGIGDPDLRPETTEEYEYGADLGLFGNRVNVVATYYTKTTRDLLVQVPVPLSVGGVPNQFRNLGSLRNRGFELQLTGTAVDTRPFKLDLTAGLTTNDNLLVSLGADSTPIVLNTQQQHRQRYAAGGYWQRRYSYADQNGDGLIARSEVTLDTVDSYLGNPLPRRELQFQPGITLFEVFRVSGLLSYRGGYKVNNSTNRFRCAFSQNCADVNDPSAPLDLQARAVAAVLGTDAGYIEDGSFTRLRELAFSLAAPPRLARRARVSALSLTVTGRNLKTWSDYTGLDPEITSSPGTNFSSSDFLTLPPVRYWTARVNVGF